MNVCQACGQEIKISIFRGGDWCCDEHRKKLLGEK